MNALEATTETKEAEEMSSLVNTPKPVIFPAKTWYGDSLSDLDFDVKVEPLMTEDGYVIPDRMSVFRMDGGKKAYISTVSSGYNLVKHSDVIRKIEDNMNFGKEYKIKTILGAEGKWMHRIYTLFDYKVEIRKGDWIAPSFRISNSYDGSVAVNISLDCLRLVCTNGMIAPRAFGKMSYRHFGNKLNSLNKVLGEEVQQLFSGFSAYCNNWRGWIDAKVSNERADLVLNYMPKNLQPLIKNRYSENFDGTRYGLYNSYTAALTHDFKSSRQVNVDMQQIILGTNIANLFSRDFYWNADEDVIMKDLVKRHKIKVAKAEEEMEEEPIEADFVEEL